MFPHSANSAYLTYFFFFFPPQFGHVSFHYNTVNIYTHIFIFILIGVSLIKIIPHLFVDLAKCAFLDLGLFEYGLVSFHFISFHCIYVLIILILFSISLTKIMPGMFPDYVNCAFLDYSFVFTSIWLRFISLLCTEYFYIILF